MNGDLRGDFSNPNDKHASEPAQKDFSDQFMPKWKLYVRSQLVVTAIWILFVAGSLAHIAIFSKQLAGILTVLTIVWVVYSSFTLKCPNCGKFLLIFGKSRLYLAKECQHCGAILKKSGINFPIHPWIPWEEKESREKAIIISVFAVFGILILLALFKGVKIEHQHIE